MTLDHAAIGRQIRDHRESRELSVRALAGRSGVSAAYLTALERGRNPSTGRPPVPSLDIVARLADALDLDLDELVRVGPAPAVSGAHVLAYVLEPPSAGLMPALDALLGTGVDHWLHIADPRSDAACDPQRVTTCTFALGAPPYEAHDLDGAELVAAVGREAHRLSREHRGRRVGIVIADCSAVMRYLRNAAAEVDLELIWHDRIEHIWQTEFGAPPAADVCAYDHADIAALGLTIDQLSTALALITRHDRVLVLEGDDVHDGEPAVRRMLEGARPPGTTPAAWLELTRAAARGLVA